ncbi:MAG: histidine phosphatase family protein [Cellulosilyticaceae bacterium]
MIYLIRQGETDWNLLKKFNGRTETELNEAGIRQAHLQAERLKGIHLDACFCSTQIRARQTCEMIYSGEIIFDERLVEINCGEFEGTQETTETFKLFWQATATGKMGTEIFEEFVKRNCELCDMIRDHYKDKNILIVTHAANARIVNYYFTGKSSSYDFHKPVARNGEIVILQNE